ncbi:unnamed protein product [Nezara viridula]|uniref:Uncharacterized protein n=1 Tax=Nezara viridula TaxID=85310 RepID=A0A9P0HK40_NEZVI|nr:unnamed protein product [Nezara viridula]
MGKEQYLTPALVTVAACTIGAYLIWRQAAISAVEPSNNNEVVVRTRNRRTEIDPEDKATAAEVIKSTNDHGYIQMSGHYEASSTEFHDSKNPNFSVSLHTLCEVSKECINEDQISEPNRISDELKTTDEYTGFASSLEQTITEVTHVEPLKISMVMIESSESINDTSDSVSNEDIDIHKVILLDLRQIPGHEDTLPDLPQNKSYSSETPDFKSNEAIKNNAILSDLYLTCGCKSEGCYFKSNEKMINNRTVIMRDLPPSSRSEIEVLSCKSNPAIDNKTLKQTNSEEYISRQEDTLPDLSQDFGSTKEIPFCESNRSINNNTIVTEKSQSVNVVSDCGFNESINNSNVLDGNSGSLYKGSYCESNEAMNNNNVTMQHLPQAELSETEMYNFEQNPTVTLQDLPQTSKPINEMYNPEPNNTATLQDLPQTLINEMYNPEPNNSMPASDDTQKILGFIGLMTPPEELNKKVFSKKRSRRNPMHLALREGNLSLVRSLLRQGASMDFTDRQGQFPTHLAAASGNIELLEMLVSWGGDLSRKDLFGYTPFHRAALSGQTETIKWLYEHGGGFIKEISWAGWTPLHVAAMNGHYDTSLQLLEFGANVNAKDNDGWTPSYLAKLYQRTEVLKLLKSRGGTF